MNAAIPEVSLTDVGPCDLCGSTARRTIMRKRGRLITREFSMRECTCGLVLVDPRLSDHDIDALYDEAYYRGDGFDATVDYRLTVDDLPSRAEAIENVVESLAEAAGSLAGKRALDIGCGNGDLVAALRRRGADAIGSDASQSALQICADRGIPAVPRSSVDDFPQRSFDIVSAMEVIEHVQSPTAFVQRLSELLAPGGILFIMTGNWSLVKRIPGTPYIMPEGHIVYFTPKTLRALFAKVGLRETRTLNRTWIGYRALRRFCGPIVAAQAARVIEPVVQVIAPAYAANPIGVVELTSGRP